LSPDVDVSQLLTGVSPVLEVPFDEHEDVDYDGFEALVHHVLRTGVRSVMFPGYASEFHKLSDEERTRLRDLLLAVTTGRVDVAAIVSVSDHSTALAVRKATAAVERGADAINLLPPYLLGPSPAAVREHIVAVADAVRPAPVVLQVAPAQTGTSLDADTIRSIAQGSPNLRHVKVESAPSGPLIADLAAGDPALFSFIGSAGLQLVDGLRRGAVGVQPGCSFVELYCRVWECWTSGAHADAVALHSRMLPYLSYWMQSVELIVAAEKLISLRRGMLSAAVCRRPAHRLDIAEIAMVDRFMQEFDAELGPVQT
jgi:4-hydroxy-tetrahydrodipicolinate synthase